MDTGDCTISRQSLTDSEMAGFYERRDLSANDLPSCLHVERRFPDTHEETHSLVCASVQKELRSSRKVLRTAESWHMAVNERDAEVRGGYILMGADMKETVKEISKGMTRCEVLRGGVKQM